MEIVALPGNDKKMSLHAFMSWVHLSFPGKEARNLDPNHTHWDLIFNSAILGQDRGEQGKRLGQYTSTKTVLVNHMKKPKM